MSDRTTDMPSFKDLILDGDLVLTDAEIIEFGLEEAPADAGPSNEEIAATRQGRPDHG